ncbi:MAG: hypothetical protein IAE95_03265 [Chitinophagaceae bacterium]|nr:hypothetical protein [Chitinophagaceae bacterium]
MSIVVLTTGNEGRDRSNVLRQGEECETLIIMDEQCNTDLLRNLQKSGTKIYPDPDVIDIMRDKEYLLNILEENGIPAVTGWEVVANVEETDHNRKETHNYQRDTLNPIQTLAFRTNKHKERLSNSGREKTHAFAAGKIVSVAVTRTSDNTITCHTPILMISTDSRIYADHRMCNDEGEREWALASCRSAANVASTLGLTGTVTVEIACDDQGNAYVNEINLLPNTGFSNPNYKAHPVTRELGEVLDLLPDTNRPLRHTGIIEPAAFKKNAVRGALRVLTFPEEARTHAPVRLNDEMEMNELMARSMMVQHLLHN